MPFSLAIKKPWQEISLPHPRVFQTLLKNQKPFQLTHTPVLLIYKRNIPYELKKNITRFYTRSSTHTHSVVHHLFGTHGKMVNSLFIVEVHLAIKVVGRHPIFNNVKET